MRLSNGMVLPYDTEIFSNMGTHLTLRNDRWTYLDNVVLQEPFDICGTSGTPLTSRNARWTSLSEKDLHLSRSYLLTNFGKNNRFDPSKRCFYSDGNLVFKVRWSSSPHQVWYTGNQNWGITSFTEMQQVLSKLVEGGGARGCGGNPSDNHTWSKTFGSPPKCLCPNYHTQLDWFQYKLL